MKEKNSLRRKMLVKMLNGVVKDMSRRWKDGELDTAGWYQAVEVVARLQGLLLTELELRQKARDGMGRVEVKQW